MVFSKSVLEILGSGLCFLSPLTLTAYTASSQLDHSHCLITGSFLSFPEGFLCLEFLLSCLRYLKLHFLLWG